jgi:glycosyltransferase involved in cell wall biosynthesis
MRVLQLCSKPLFAPFDGGKIAMIDAAKGLRENGIEVVQWMIHTRFHTFPKQFTNDAGQIIEKSFIDTSINWKSAFLNLFKSQSYNIQRFDNKKANNELIAVIEKYKPDIIHSESIYCLTAIEEIKKRFDIPIVLRAHNVEHQIWERTAQITKNPIKKLYLNILVKKLKKDELRIANYSDAVITFSEVDKQFFKHYFPLKKLEVIGIGTRLKKSFSPTFPISNIFHIGGMDWKPNQDGINWFLNDCWPLIHASYPQLECILAGLNMPQKFYELENINVKIKVANDAEQFMNQHQILFVPLLSGSGVRVKIIEALALGKVVIATSIAAEGLGVTDNINILIANSKEDFLKQITKCLEKSEVCLKISENAAIFAQENFNTLKNSQKLIALYNRLLKN